MYVCKSRFLKSVRGSSVLKMVWTQPLLNCALHRVSIEWSTFEIPFLCLHLRGQRRHVDRVWGGAGGRHCRQVIASLNQINLENIKLWCVSTFPVPLRTVFKVPLPPKLEFCSRSLLSPLLVTLSLLCGPHQEWGVPALRQGARPWH